MIVGIPTNLSIGIPTILCDSIVGMATHVGDRLRRAREELQQREGEPRPNRSKFARELGITPASLSDIESGESKEPSSETLLALRDRGINPDYVMRGKGPKFIDHVERHMNKQTILGLMDEMDENEQQTVIDVAAAIVRKRPGPGTAADPFKKKPPKSDH